MASIIKRPRNKTNPFAVRWRDASGKQREQAFPTMRLASDAKIKLEHDQRSGSFIDPTRGDVPFIEYAASVIELQRLSEGSRKLYNGILRVWLTPFANGRSLAQVANDREGVQKLVNIKMKRLSLNRRGTAITILLKTVNEAVAAGRLQSHRLSGIDIIEGDALPKADDSFVFPSYDQVSKLASQMNGYGIVVWLMRSCGLRVGEALAVEKGDFTKNGTLLKLQRQAHDDGSHAIPLKHRKAGQYRIVPVPSHLWAMVRELPEGVLCKPHDAKPYITYDTFANRFKKVAAQVGIEKGFTAHSLRHAFITHLLTNGASLHAVAKWVGHSDVNFLIRTYAHVLNDSIDDARSVLDAEFSEWSS